ncbi:putative halogenase [Mycena sp. CBHHK59/15]|nr:putative halogenase [Mycena sp. CBHHK59/15]
MPALDIPTSTNILVVGGGPAGSYAATALAREGFEVTLLEKEHFPRYHIGESMLSSCRPFLRYIGAEEKVSNYGFCVKVGGAVKFKQDKREGYTDFIHPDPSNASWNVDRSEFDEILLRNATENGVCVSEGVEVTAFKFSNNDSRKPIAAEWKSDMGGAGELQFNWLVDCSGRNGIMSTKYLKNRKFNTALRSIACWGYWTGANKYAPGTRRENAIWLEALTDETGWAWFIPLHGNRVSVGVVLKEESSRSKKAKLSGPDRATQYYHDQIKLAPGVVRLLGDAKFLGEVESAADYSYSAADGQYAGLNYRIAGDAGAFIDPFFSSGVHLAFGGALSAASTISASIRGQCTEEEAIRFHNEKTGTSYTRFLLVVLSAYQQITSQSVSVLSDIDEDNFDRAFDFIRPVIQGATETDQNVTEEMIQRAMDFCEHALGQTDPEMHAEVAKRRGFDADIMGHDGPILGPRDAAAMAGDDEEAKNVLWRVNARKAVESIRWQPNFRGESFNGLSIVMERGALGLARFPVAA